MAHEMARVSDLLYEVFSSIIPTFTFVFCFIGHPELAASVRGPLHCGVKGRKKELMKLLS